MLITYKFDLCLLSNEPLLTVKRIFACGQTNLCLLSNEPLLAVNNTQPLTLHHTPYLQHGQGFHRLMRAR